MNKTLLFNDDEEPVPPFEYFWLHGCRVFDFIYRLLHGKVKCPQNIII